MTALSMHIKGEFTETDEAALTVLLSLVMTFKASER